MQKNKALPLNGTRHNLAYKPPTKDNHPLCLNAANTFPPTCKCFSRTTRERNSSYGGTKGLPAYAPLSVYTVFHTLTNSVSKGHSQKKFSNGKFLGAKASQMLWVSQSLCFGILFTSTIIYNPVTNCK